jgi:uncharacterized protein
VRAVVLILAAAALFVAVAAARLAARVVGRARRAPPPPRWVAALDRALLAGTLLGAALYGYGHWIEPRRVEITATRVPLAAMRPGSRPVRLVLLADVHSPTNAWLQRRLPPLVAALRPDLVVFAGDALGARAGLAPFRETMAALAAAAPTFAVRGNADDAFPDVDPFAGTGARELRGAGDTLRVGNVTLRLVGASRRGDWRRVHGALRGAPAGEVTVYVAHSPDVADDVAAWGADLVVAGHTHGGQVALPGYGAVWTASRFGKRFEAGLYRVGSARLYVTRGVGMERLLPKVRLGARPEVALLTLVPATVELAPAPNAARPGPEAGRR